MVAAILDVYRRIIPNYLVIAILIYGGAWDYLHSDISGVIASMAYCVMVAVILYPLYMTGSLGAGDVKLYSLLPLYYIREKLLIIYFLIFLIALALAIIRQLRHPHGRGIIPMALPLAIGVLISIIADNMGYTVLLG